MQKLIASTLAILLIGFVLAYAQRRTGGDGPPRVPLSAQTPQRAVVPQAKPIPTHADILRGEYGRYRANNDLLFYHLDIRVDPEKKFLSGKNTIRFKMLKDDARIQLDLHEALKVEKILLDTTPLKYVRELGTVWVDFPETPPAGRV